MMLCVSRHSGAGITNAGGYLAAAHVISANATNCVVAGDAVNVNALIFVHGVGAQ
jgi:hypothetical protein